MNNTEQMILTADQKHLRAELAATYGIDQDEVIFFAGQDRPIFTYEAACVLANRLTDLDGIEIEPVNNGFVDSISCKCNLTLADGAKRSAVGVANLGEKDAQGNNLKSSQLAEMASGRAIRNALRVADIDLLKLHRIGKEEAFSGFSGPSASNWQSLLRLCHALGNEAGLIVGQDKSLWYGVINKRYGCDGADHLTEDQLADFSGFLRTLAPQTRQKAA